MQVIQRATRPAIAAMSVLALALSTLPAAGQTRLKIGTVAPQGTSYHRIMLEMREQLGACPGDGIHLSVYPGGVLGSEAAHVQKMRIGQIQAAMLTAAGLAEIDESVNVFQKLPLLYQSFAEVEYVRQHLDSTLTSRLRAKGFVVLFWADAGWLHLFSRDPGTRPSEFANMKMLVSADDATEADLMTDAGMHPVPLETHDVLAALRTGMVDVFPTLPFHALAGQVYTTTRHMLNLKWAPLMGGMVVTDKFWDKLTPADQACLGEAAREAGRKIQESARQENAEATAAMRDKHGLRVHEVTPEVEAEWRELGERFWPAIRGSLVPADIYDEAQRLLRAYRAETLGRGA